MIGKGGVELNINKRIYSIREALSLSQEAFGKRIGVTRSAISNYESGGRNVTEQVMKSIIREFRVNEEWLKFGEGEMFVETRNSFLSGIANQYNLDELDQTIIRSYLSLNSEQREGIKSFLKHISKSIEDEETAAAISIDEELAKYRQELEAEVKGAEKSSVLQDIEEEREAN